MAFLQTRPSLGSPAGLIALLIGTAIALFILTQFDFTRRLIGASARGEFKMNNNA
jgi:hypothetical protein